jgi:rhomboid protease GluP
MTNETSAQPEQVRIQVVALPDYKPIVTYTILGITVFIYLLQIGTLYLLKIDLPGALGSKVNELIIDGQFWRLFTPMLLHDDRLPFHILTNMYFLAVVGARTEKFAGHWTFLLLYVVAGFAGNVFSFLFSANPAWGASTSLFGLMGTQVIFALHNRSFLHDNGKEPLQNALSLIVINVIIGFAIQADNWGHLGGLAGGALFAWFGGVKLDLEEIAFPRFRLMDVRTWGERLFAAALVMGVFGGFAVLKITGIAF